MSFLFLVSYPTSSFLLHVGSVFFWKETEESMCMSDLGVFAYEGDTGSILNRNQLWILWKGILNLFDGEFQAIKTGSELWTGHSRAIWAVQNSLSQCCREDFSILSGSWTASKLTNLGINHNVGQSCSLKNSHTPEPSGLDNL